MLKHLENLVRLLASIDQKLTSFTEIADLLRESGLPRPETPTPDGKLEPYLDKEDVKEYLGIKETAYYRWVKEGKLKPRGGEGQHKYYLRDIQQLMEQRKYRYRG